MNPFTNCDLLQLNSLTCKIYNGFFFFPWICRKTAHIHMHRQADRQADRHIYWDGGLKIFQKKKKGIRVGGGGII